ncbi:MAG TPA: hypothetical protein VNW92_08615, partial [Polyangiaceae bacterium]|nr:hypothetical protein [Polyangiaceae bacterium]
SAGSNSSAGSSGSGSCGGPRSTPVGRPQEVACPASVGGVDAGACTTDTECTALGIGYNYCRDGACTRDQCATDTDCASGQACRCWNQVRGNALFGNACTVTGCRVDADCGPKGTCSPDSTGYCGSFTGYYCHTAADACNSDADCCGSTPRCGYQPQLGHWVCGELTVCTG